MDPLQDRFCRVLMELVAARESYLVVETAAGTGNRLLRFCSKAEIALPFRCRTATGTGALRCSSTHNHEISQHTDN